MKRVLLAVVSSVLFCASAYADDSMNAAAPAAAPATAMSEADCTDAIAKCADQACKDALVKDHGCKADAKPA